MADFDTKEALRQLLADKLQLKLDMPSFEKPAEPINPELKLEMPDVIKPVPQDFKLKEPKLDIMPYIRQRAAEAPVAEAVDSTIQPAAPPAAVTSPSETAPAGPTREEMMDQLLKQRIDKDNEREKMLKDLWNQSRKARGQSYVDENGVEQEANRGVFGISGWLNDRTDAQKRAIADGTNSLEHAAESMVTRSHYAQPPRFKAPVVADTEMPEILQQAKLADELTSGQSGLAGISPILELQDKLTAMKDKNEYEKQLEDPNSEASRIEVAAYNAAVQQMKKDNPEVAASMPEAVVGKTTGKSLRAKAGGKSWVDTYSGLKNAAASQKMAEASLGVSQSGLGIRQTEEQRKRDERESLYREAPKGFVLADPKSKIKLSSNEQMAAKQKLELETKAEALRKFRDHAYQAAVLWGDEQDPNKLSPEKQAQLKELGNAMMQDVRSLDVLMALQQADIDLVSSFIPGMKDLMQEQTWYGSIAKRFGIPQYAKLPQKPKDMLRASIERRDADFEREAKGYGLNLDPYVYPKIEFEKKKELIPGQTAADRAKAAAGGK